MGLIIGPTPWWQANIVAACPEGTTLPDGSIISSKVGGNAYIVSPLCTQVCPSQWAGGQYNSTLVGDKCCICEWPELNNRLIQCGFNPCDWCVPSLSDLSGYGIACRSKLPSGFFANYTWSSTESTSTQARSVDFNVNQNTDNKSCFTVIAVRAFRKVTY